MAYNKEELLNLPVNKKQELAEALWNSIDDELLPVTEDEITFAMDRLKMHEANKAEGMSRSEFKSKIQQKYGF